MDFELSEIYHFLPISDNLATGGMPTEEQFTLLQAAGYQTVINLAIPNQAHATPNEDEIVTALGMEYISIPVVWNNPTATDLDRAFDAFDANADKKLFVHCMANYRVSAFIYLYRVLRLGVPPAEAEAQLHQIWQPNEIWARFIEQGLAARGYVLEDESGF
jgi:protein tyrosine phosphatase (PTP) superfamily phosphohydrolase (DUF442 family)